MNNKRYLTKYKTESRTTHTYYVQNINFKVVMALKILTCSTDLNVFDYSPILITVFYSSL